MAKIHRIGPVKIKDDKKKKGKAVRRPYPVIDDSTTNKHLGTTSNKSSGKGSSSE